MDLSASMQAAKELFLFPTRDPKWKNKLLIGTGITLAGYIIPVIPWLMVGGYGARLLRAGAANAPAEQLPEWDDWGDLMMDGLRLVGAGFLVSLPTLVLMFGGYFVYMISVISIASQDNGNMGPGGAMLMFGAMGVMFLAMGLGSLLGLATAVFTPSALAHIAVQRRFTALFDVRGWWRILRANFTGFVLALVIFLTFYTLMMIGWQILYFTFILCFLAPILILPLAFYGGLILQRLIGQAYGEGLRKVAPLEIADDPEDDSVIVDARD